LVLAKLSRIGVGPWVFATALVIVGGFSPGANAQSVRGEASFSSDDSRYTLLARNTRNGDGGAQADTCRSNAGNEPCLNMVNFGNGLAAAFRTRGTTGFRLQTSGSGQATPFVLDANATGKVTSLNADQVDGIDDPNQIRAQFALVSGDGSLAGGNGATASTRVAEGTYDVTFGNSNITNCAFTATEATVTDAGAVGVERQSETVVRVRTRKGGGGDGQGRTDPENRPFHLVVNC